MENKTAEPTARVADSPARGLASERWRILRRAILAAKREGNGQAPPIRLSPYYATDLASVRRFSSFELFTISELSPEQLLTVHHADTLERTHSTSGNTSSQPHGKWYMYEYDQLIHCDVAVRYITESTSLEAMMGFNNTGNVCLWPSEEVLAYYCLKHAEMFRGAAVCELGCGMTGLAGLMLATTQQPSQVLLTDGNCKSVENVNEIIRENYCKFGHTTASAETLVWDKAFTRSASPHHSKFDYVICADCLFFEEVHQELVQVMLKLLKPSGTVLILAPRRSGTMERFCSVAKRSFLVDLSLHYDDVVWEKHAALKESSVYSTDLHYPLRLTLRPL